MAKPSTIAPAKSGLGMFSIEGVRRNDLIVPLGLVFIIGLMILPLPPLMLDLLLATNITLSLVMLLTAVNVRRPLDFSVFPSLLLVTTLFRLALNISTTRLILLEGHTGVGAAGDIVQTFGDFVVGGSYVVGAVVFLILTLINFVVITKGSGRVAEVGARFTLDALPGKQMSIDSDLASGLITQDQARIRRRDLSNETDFYGAMDGSSKFVRGDAVAGLIITFINILGGLIIGVAQQDMGVGDAAQTYTILTIGDGLVSQIPALLVSTAAGLVVTRTASDGKDLGGQLAAQLLGSPKVMVATAMVLVGLMLVPGMPTFAFLALIVALLFGARRMPGLLKISAAAEEAAERDGAGGVASPAGGAAPASRQSGAGGRKAGEETNLEDVLPVQMLELEVGYGLIPLVSGGKGGTEQGDLVNRVTALRQNFARNLGIILPPLHLRDNLELAPGGYRLLVHGVADIEGEIMPNRLMAMDPGDVRETVPGVATTEPAFGLPALWIRQADQTRAELSGYTVVPPAAVVITHVSEALMREAHQLIGREELQSLLDIVAERAPRVVDELIPTVLSHIEILAVIRMLLIEQVSVRDMRTILETLAESARHSKTTHFLAEQVRQRLGPRIAQSLVGHDGKLHAAIFDAPSEDALRSVVVRHDGDVALAPDLSMARELLAQLQTASTSLHELGHSALIVAPSDLRYPLWKFASRFLPQVRFMAQNELPPRLELITHRTMSIPRRGARQNA